MSKETQDVDTQKKWNDFFTQVRKDASGYPVPVACSVSKELFSRDEKFVKKAASNNKFRMMPNTPKGIVSFEGV